MKHILLLVSLFCVLTLQAQERNLTVRVLTPSGEAFPSVRVIHSGNHKYTDKEGYITLYKVQSSQTIDVGNSYDNKLIKASTIEKDTLVVTLEPNVRGYIKNSIGKPLKNIEVELVTKNGNKKTLTSKLGYFLFLDVNDLNNTLQIHDPNGNSLDKKMEISYDVSAPIIHVNLAHSQQRDLAIRVLTPTGDVFPDMAVTVSGVSSTTNPDENGYGILKNVNPDNSITLGNYSLALNPKKINASTIKSDTIDVTVIPRIRGVVKDFTGQLASNIQVELTGRTGAIKTKTDNTGYFSLDNIAIDSESILRLHDPKKYNLDKEAVIEYDIDNPHYQFRLEQYISPLLISSRDTLGVVYLDDNTPRQAESSSMSSFEDIKSLRKSGDKYIIKKGPVKSPTFYQIEYRGAFSLSSIGRTPKLQAEYAQGQSDAGQTTWQGADKNQQFSWGPAINSLEYANGAYKYDNNGALVGKGQGNGKSANVYDPTDFFNNSLSFSNSLSLRTTSVRKSILRFMFNQNKINTPIPNSHEETYNASLGIEDMQTGDFKTSFGAIGAIGDNHLITNGANYARIMHSVFTTPATFDNSNGMKRSKALKNNSSWQLPDGSTRSYAPNDVANPYYLTSQLPDKSNNGSVTGYAKTTFKKEKFETDASVSYNYQWDDLKVGKAFSNPMDILTREEKRSDLSVSVSPKYRVDKYPVAIDLKGGYTFNRTTDEVSRMDATLIDRSRNSSEFMYGMGFTLRNLYAEVYNKHYVSNTAKDYTNLFPSVGAKYSITNFDKINDFFYDVFDRHVFDYVAVRATSNRSLSEAPLVYRNLAVLSTLQTSSDALKSYYEDQEILRMGKKMKPETFINNEVGLELKLLNNRFAFEATYYNNTTHNMLAPVYTNSSFVLNNVGRLNNYGYLLNANYLLYSGWGENAFKGQFGVNFSQMRNRVRSVYGNEEKIQLAGFSNVGTFFTKNEPLGVIYGSTYKRNEQGEVLIDNDGFPEKDPTLRKIGNPTPDYIMNFTADLSWRRFSLALNIEYSHGGDRWNGTQAYLDYLGMSKNTADQRNKRAHIFEGVDAIGNRNAKSVDFYNPALPMDQNRWVRYGADGVGEEYIQDASSLRLSDLSFNYLLVKADQSRFLSQVLIGIHAENLLFFSAYKGVDVNSNLFGYTTGKGLDLFNSPSIKKYSLSVTVKF